VNRKKITKAGKWGMGEIDLPVMAGEPESSKTKRLGLKTNELRELRAGVVQNKDRRLFLFGGPGLGSTSPSKRRDGAGTSLAGAARKA
jgi:hypothetical protein